MQRTETGPPVPAVPETPVDLPSGVPQVDLRVLQANERTLLAWIRTSLTLMAFGFVVARISPWLTEADIREDNLWSTWVGAAFLLLGTISNIVAASRYIQVRAAVLEGRPVIPGHMTILSLAFGLALLGALLAAHAVLH